jgi:hypothetical protein
VTPKARMDTMEWTKWAMAVSVLVLMAAKPAASQTFYIASGVDAYADGGSTLVCGGSSTSSDLWLDVMTTSTFSGPSFSYTGYNEGMQYADLTRCEYATQSGSYYANGEHSVYIGYVYFLGYTSDSEYVTVNAQVPVVSSIGDYSAPAVRGGAGQATVYGTAVCVGSPYVEVADGIHASVVSSSCSDSSQLRISFSIPASTASGSHQLTVTTSAGSGTGSFVVYDPTPMITYVDPSEPWEAGGVVSFTVYGSGFGALPTLAFSGANVGSSSVLSRNDTAISGWVDLTYAGSGNLTLTVTSNGYTGQSFAPAPQGGSTGQGTRTVGVVSCPVPASEVSTSGSWCSTCVGASFVAYLKDAGGATPPNGKYAGRSVKESLSTAQDGCHFQGSEKDLITEVAPPKDPWDVSSVNGYGADAIYLDRDIAVYYRNAIRDGSAPYTSCTVNVLQTMSINACGSNTWIPYESNQDTKNIITSDQMTAIRGAGQASGPIN